MKTDTIAAIATAMTNSGIGIVRISGEEAFQVIDRIYRSKSGEKKLSNEPSHTIHYGWIVDGDRIIDEVMVAIMRAPKTYTREDTVEIDCHGGVLIMKDILETVIRNGARIAEPGEYTKRAFLNGRIDLSQAEAVMDFINAQNESAKNISFQQLHGALSDKIRNLRKIMLHHLAFIESALDDPEHISLDGYANELSNDLEKLMKMIKELLNTSENGRILTQGIKTVILGKPNVGKSSILNILAGEERAIVTDIAGTTRDILTERIQINGIHFNIVDTAGIRETEDIVEKIGVERAKAAAEDADLILYVLDSSRELEEEDKTILSFLQDKEGIILLNKSDLKQKLQATAIMEKTGKKVISISAKDKTGIEEFEKAVEELFFIGNISYENEIIITNIRHKNALQETYQSLELVKKSIDDQMPEDFYTIDLMNAYEQLGFIIGESLGEDLVEEIFREFCMGK